MFDRIFFPTDGSETAEDALEIGVELASVHDARLDVLSVVDVTSLGVDVYSEGQVDVLEERAETVIDEHDVDLVVLGTHGRSGLDRYLLGSVAEKIVRTAPVPVLTVPGTQPDQ